MARKQEAALRVLRGESLELASRSLGTTAAKLSSWRDAFLDGGATSLKSRSRDAREEGVDRLRAKLGETAMANELLDAEIEKLEAGHPLVRRRLQR